MNSTIRVAKTKALISFTAKLICAFVFAYADCWFSHAEAQFTISIERWVELWVANAIAIRFVYVAKLKHVKISGSR